MNTIRILNISDIHFERNEPENQGLVINSFFRDLENTIGVNEIENNYCIISGDLVNKGNSEKIYDTFYEKFIKNLLKYVPIENIFCIPGNHDVNRGIIQDNIGKHTEILAKEYSETEFNDFIKDEHNLIFKVFSHYANFCKSKLKMKNFNLFGFSELTSAELSIFFLNTALFSSGGLNNVVDDGILKIETSELNKWINENHGRKKIVVMHHPIEHLTKFGSTELKSMLRDSIDILISGHIHEQELDDNYISEGHGYKRLGAPQLFSNKKDLNGYGILTFIDNELSKIEYRQWYKKHRKFMPGLDFSGTEDGIRRFVNSKKDESDYIFEKLNRDFNKSMQAYSRIPNWIQRTLSTQLLNSNSKEKELRIDYLSIINKPINYQIIAAPQFGLTSFAKYLSMKVWEIKKENWAYFDCQNWNLSKYLSDIDDYLAEYKISISELKCLLLDNWRNSIKDSHKIFEKIKRQFPSVPIIILTNYNETIMISGLDTEESHEGFQQLYLRELDKSGLRKIVRNINNEHQIAEENNVLERLSLDLSDLNSHRTPLNCLQLLLAFLKNYEDRPVNRSKVFSYLLKLIFDNPGKLFYGDTIDEANCIFILGNFCEYLFRNKKNEFTEVEFLNISIPFSKENYNTSNISDLLQILKNNQIVIECYGCLRFRYSYWVYYFAAERMKISTDFFNFMFNSNNAIYSPEIIEFYTGTDGAREDAVIILTKELDNLTNKVHSNIGLKEDVNPFSDIKWSLNETSQGMTVEQLEQNVQNSKLPDEIKDVIADKDYNSVKPYNQTISNFLEEYDVKNLMDLAKSSSRALRNSEFITPLLKEEMMQSILKAWEEIVRVLLLIAPILAKNGIGGIGGARFKLAENFPKEYEECLKTVIVHMPFNVMEWNIDDIFSDKLELLFTKYLELDQNPIVRHILALLICAGKPKNWEKIISEYIGAVDKNSFFLGDLYFNLRHNYVTKLMSRSNEIKTINLIKSCWAKHNKGTRLPGKGTISKISNDILPERNLSELG
jgi:UDP-2,3-diacylglucosamine pyrophosphatase LpxH